MLGRACSLMLPVNLPFTAAFQQGLRQLDLHAGSGLIGPSTGKVKQRNFLLDAKAWI